MKNRSYILILILLGLLAAPWVVPPFYVTLMLTAFAYAIVLLGFNLLFGYTGLMSFGHAMFVALGAYSSAYMTDRFGIDSMEASILLAIGISLLVGIPIGLLCVRYTKIFFGMLTLAFGMLFYSFLFKFYEFTGGDSGIPIGRPSLLGMTFADMDKIDYLVGPFYYYALGLMLLLGYLMWRIVHSPFGLHLQTIRDNPRKAEYVGVKVYQFRLIAFVISAIYGVIGGALLTVPVGLADPKLAYWTHSGDLVFMTILGGFGNFFGPVLGAFAFVGLQNELMSLTQYWRFALGVILILIVIGLPRGLMGLSERSRRPGGKAAKPPLEPAPRLK